MKLLETLVGLMEVFTDGWNMGPQVGDRYPPKYQALFSDGALTAPPYVIYRVRSSGS